MRDDAVLGRALPLDRGLGPTRVRIVNAATFSVKYFNPSSVKKHLQKVVCFMLFIYSRAFNNSVIFNVVLVAVTTLLLTSGLHRCQQRIFKKNTNNFYAVRISILLAILSEIFIQIGYFLLRDMEENNSGCFFSEHSVVIMPPTVGKGAISVAFVRPSVRLSVRPSRTQ